MPDDKKYKLWESLNSAGYYTKTYDEFNKQFSTPESQEKLFSALSNNGYYTKTQEEFTTQFFGVTESKKKESSEPSTGVGVGTKKESATPQLGGGEAEEKQSVEPITQVGDEFQTVSEVKSGKKLPQNEYLREGVSYTKEEYDQLNQLSQQVTNAENTISTTEKTPGAETVKMMGGEAPAIQVAKQELISAKEKQDNIIVGAKFRDPNNFFAFYDSETFKPIAVKRDEMKPFVEQFYSETFSNRPEFRGKTYDELTEDEQYVVNTAFANRYIPKDQLQAYLKSTGQDMDLSKVANAGSQFMRGLLNTTASILEGADPSKVPIADAMNILIVKAGNGLITKQEYEAGVQQQKNNLLSGIENGFYYSKDKLPGMEPLNSFEDSQTGIVKYRYSEEQINSWLNKMPGYEKSRIIAMSDAPSPYEYEPGQLGKGADALNRWEQTFKTNPVYDESFWATKVPQGMGSSVPFIVTAIATKKIPTEIITALTGGLANASQVYDEAIQGGATPDEANKAFWGGFGIGTTEAVPIERMLTRFGGKGITKKIIEGLKQGTEEGLQEAFQSIGNDQLAQWLYDESRKVGDTVNSDAGVGFVTGALMGGFTALMSRGDITPEQKKIAQEAVARLEGAITEQNKEEAIQPEEKVIELSTETKQDDSKNEQGIQGDLGERKEPVTPEPDITTSQEEAEADRIFQAQEEEVKKVAQEKGVELDDEEVADVAAIMQQEEPPTIEEAIDHIVEARADEEHQKALNEIQEEIIEPKIEQNEQDQKAETGEAEVLKQPAEVKEVTPVITEEKKSEALKKIEEAKAKLKAAQESGVPLTNLNLGKSDKTPILKSSAFQKAAAQQARQIDKQKRHVKFVDFVTDKNGKVQFIGANPSTEIQAKIDNGEFQKETVKVVVNKRTAEPEEIIRESKWKDKKRPKNRYEQLAAMAAKFQPVDLNEAIDVFLAFGGKVRGKDFTHYTGFKPGSEEYKKASWAFSDDNKTVPQDHLAEQKFKDFYKGEGKGENSVEIASKVMEAITHTSKGALLKELAIKSEDRLFADEHEGMNRDEWGDFIKDQERIEEEVRLADAEELMIDEEMAMEVARKAENIEISKPEIIDNIISQHIDTEGNVNWKELMSDEELLQSVPSEILNEIVKIANDEQARKQEEISPAVSPEEISTDKKIGNEERILNEKIAEAEQKLSDAKDELVAAEKKVLKDANKENDLFEGKEKKADEMFGAEVDVSKENLNKILEPLRAKLAKAERELAELQDPSQREAARKADQDQGDLFEESEIEKQKQKIRDLKARQQNLGITDDENKARAELMAAYTDLAILYIKAGLKSAVDFAKEIGEELSEIIQEAWDNAVIQETPTEEQPKEKKGRKKAIVGRAYRGTEDQKLRGELERVGLNYEPESWEEGKRKAREFVDAVGIDEALESVRRSLVVGAPAAYVWAEAIDKVHNEIAESTDPAEIEELTGYEADLLDEFGRRAIEGGQFISALQDVYANADFNYDLGQRLEDYRKANDGYIPPEVEAKMRDLDRKYKEALEREREAIKKMKELELVKAIADIKESVDREGATSLSPAEIEALVAKGVEQEVKKIHAKLPTARKQKAQKIYDELSAFQKRLRAGTYESTLGVPVAIIDGGITIIKNAILAGANIADAIELGVAHIRDRHGKEWKEDDFRRDLIEDLEGQGIDTSSPKDKTVKEKNGKLRIPHALIRDFVERGIMDPTELTQAVLEIVRESVPDATERQVRDAISQYGRTVNQNQEEIEKEIRQIKNALRDISAFEDIEQGKRPKKSGLQRDRPTAEERARKKKLKEALKTLPPDLEADEKSLRTTLDAIEKRLENQIEDLNREIEKGEKNVKEKRELPYTDRIKDLIAERDRVKALHEEVFGRPELTDEQRIERAIKSIDKATTNVEEQIRTGRLDSPQGRKLSSPELDSARKRLQDARTRLNELRELAGIPEKTRLENAKKAGKRRIAELQDRIDRKDFSKKVKKPLLVDDELAQIRAEKARLQDEFNRLQYELELKNRSKGQKFVDGILEAWNLTRALRATFEFSPFLIQLGFYAIPHPIHAFRSLATGISHFMSKKRAEKFQQRLEADPIYSHIREDKLSITRPDYKQSVKEEMYVSNWLNTIWNFFFREGWSPLHNLPERFELAATGMMNTMRILRYKDGLDMLQQAGITRESNPEDFKNLASIVNTATLRTSLGKGEMATKLLSFFLFSAKAWASILKTFTPYAFYEFGRMTSKNAITGKREVSVAQKMMMADYMKYLGATAGFVGMLALYFNHDDDDDTNVEFDPTSSDFMTVRIGNTRIDPWGGRRPMAVLQARIMLDAMVRTGIYDGHSFKSLSGETNRLGQPYQTPTALGLVGQMTRNKLSPSMQIVVNAMDSYLNNQGEQVDKYGNPYSLPEDVLNNLYPIYGETMKELWQDQPETIASLLTFYAFLGGGVQTYIPKEKDSIKPIPTIKSIPKIKTIE